jgi:glycolate oxidase
LAQPFSAPSPQAIEKALILLSRALGSRLLTGAEAMQPYETDDTGIIGSPAAVVLAENTADIETAVRVAHETGVPITPRAGGSGRTGGAVPIFGGIVLSTRGMDSILEIDRQQGLAVVQPGVILQDLHDAVEAEGWFFPPDPNSAAMCCLGGNVAENAAGPRSFKYGVTRDYVLGLEAIAPTGRFFSGRRTKKGVTGYDTTALLVGSEGTLAALSDITLRLIPKPEQITTLLVLFANMKDAAHAVDSIIQARLVPRCIEFLDHKTLMVMREAGNPIDSNAGALLLIEVDGTESECEHTAEQIGNLCDAAGATSVLAAQSASQRDSLWSARKSMSHAVRKRARFKLSEDVVVPRGKLGLLLDFVDQIEDVHQIDALSYGHAGDGNLHVNFLWNDDEEKARVDLATGALFKKTIELGGTLSGEHGIGLTKATFLPMEQSPVQIALQVRLKAAFDPRGVMNPGKIFPPGGHGSC